MLIEYMQADFQLENENGLLVQLVHDGWNQVNVIFSEAGRVRGGHYHKYNEECFYVYSGRFRLKVRKDETAEEYEMKAGDMFCVKPYVYHTFEYLERTLLVSMYSKGVELDGNVKDIWT